MTFEIIHKPTFNNQLLAIPSAYVVQVLEKVQVLRDDPSPQGKTKKKLHGYKGNIYRLRSGDYRIVYTYGDGWVALLGVDNRKDVYKGNKLIAEPTTLNVHTLPDTDTLLTPKAQGRRQKGQGSMGAAEQKMGYISHIHERGYRNHPLNEDQKASNREKSKTRARVEHVFGHWVTSMGGKLVRCIGLKRVQAHQGLKALSYNLSRYVFLQKQASVA